MAFPSARNHVWHPPQGLGEQSKVTLLFRTARPNWLFSQISPNPPRMLPVLDVIHIPYFLSGIFILTSVNDTSSPHARQHLRSILHLTNPCAKRKVLSLTKTKGKIYKMKSLGNYITVRQHTKSDNFGMLFICAFPCWWIDNILNPLYVLGST